MKPGNFYLVLLTAFLSFGILVTDMMLVSQYKKLNLKDPYRNYVFSSIAPFAHLHITGGNGYAIKVIQGDVYGIRLLKSRQSFYKLKRQGDTAIINFTVASQNYQRPEEATVGLIIVMTRVTSLQFSGTNNEVGPFKQHSLFITQDNNTTTRLKEMELYDLKLTSTNQSSYDFITKNHVSHLAVDVRNSSSVHFHAMNVEQFSPVVADSAALVMYGPALKTLLR